MGDRFDVFALIVIVLVVLVAAPPIVGQVRLWYYRVRMRRPRR